MTQARDEFAKKLSGREYRDEITRAEEAEATAARLLVVFAASDDLTEFRGIIDDEAGAFDGAQHKIAQVGGEWQVVVPDGERSRRKQQKGAVVRAIWSPKEIDASWLIQPTIPHAAFDIMENGDLYCRGAVIDEADLLPAQRVLGVSRDPDNTQMMFVSFSAPLADDDLRGVHEHLKGWER